MKRQRWLVNHSCRLRLPPRPYIPAAGRLDWLCTSPVHLKFHFYNKSVSETVKKKIRQVY